MVRFDDIYKALEVYISNIPDLPKLVFENESYEPVRGTPFVEVEHSVDQPTTNCIGKYTDFRYRGFVKFFINTDVNKGKAETQIIANKILSAFPYNQYIENNFSGEPLHIRLAPEVNQSRKVDPWYRTPIYVYWEQEK